MDLDRIYIVVNRTKPGALQALADLKVWCQERRIEVIPVHDVRPRDEDRAMVLALGGDGTVLRAASLFGRTAIPILGVNIGSLGFLSQTSIDRLQHAMGHILRGEFRVEERMRLAYEAPGISGTVLNDIVITGVAESHFCELALTWDDGDVASYPGDGLILSTATGSTAYSLSAGGPVIVPPAACILATPHAAHKLGVRPVIFPPDEVLRVVALQKVQLIADGDAVGHVEEGAHVVVRRATEPTHLIRLEDAPGFFFVLEEKLNWANPLDRRRGVRERD